MLISMCSKQSLVIITVVLQLISVFQTVLSNYHRCADVDVGCSIQHIAVTVIVLKWILGVPKPYMAIIVIVLKWILGVPYNTVVIVLKLILGVPYNTWQLVIVLMLI